MAMNIAVGRSVAYFLIDLLKTRSIGADTSRREIGFQAVDAELESEAVETSRLPSIGSADCLTPGWRQTLTQSRTMFHATVLNPPLLQPLGKAKSLREAPTSAFSSCRDIRACQRDYPLSAVVSGHGADSIPDQARSAMARLTLVQWLGSEHFLEAQGTPNGFNLRRHQARCQRVSAL
jgi:hypothetical protein